MSTNNPKGNKKQINKLLNVLERRKPQLNNLLMRFILVVLLLIIFFISLDLYLYNYQPIVLSKFQYSYYKEGENVPPGILSSNNLGSGEGKNFIDAEKLGKCAAGFCALDKASGLKRCPDGNYQIVYNTEKEVCTRKEFCDDDFLSYAVLNDGTTSRNGKCDPGVPCRCTFEKRCNSGIISPFQVIFGSNFDPSQNNFSIDQFPNYDTQYGYDSIQLPAPATEFCDINPAFTSKIINGCDFQNSVRDKLDCQNISSVIPVSNTPGVSSESGRLNKNIKVGDTSFVSLKFVNNESNEGTYLLNSLPNQGYLEFSNYNDNTDSNKITELVYYNRLNKDAKNTITVSGITHLESSPPTLAYGTLGFGLSWSSASIKSQTGVIEGTCTSIASYELENVNCSIATDGPNFKNMIICTQENRQPCKQGTLSYNFDKIRGTNTTTNGFLTNESFSRNFCQQRKNIDANQFNNTYLQDPAFYTMSCYLGSGCNDTKLILNNEEGLKAASGKYYPDVDVSGIKGQWDVITTSYPVINLTLEKGSLINSNSIEPGDFWSVKSSSETLVTSKKSDSGTDTIFVQSLLSLNSYINIGDINTNVRPIISVTLQNGTSSNFSVVNCKYTENNGFTMDVTPNLPSGFNIPKNNPIKVNPINMNGEGFVYYGIVGRNISQSGTDLEGIKKPPLQLFSIDGENINQTIDENFNIVIFKQFSFSGGNYNTIIYNDRKNNNGLDLKRRVYSGSSTSPIFGKSSYGGNEISPLIPPQNISNIFLNQSNIGTAELTNTASSFQGTNEPFKIPMSMYYPVWNPVTFQQECIRCKPNLVAYPELGLKENIERVIIQYSARDFLNYEYDILNNGFVFTSVSELDSSKINTTKVFNLKEPNPNLQIGDGIMSFNLKFPVSVFTNTGTSAGYKQGYGEDLTLIPQLTYSNKINQVEYGFEESQNADYNIPPNISNRNETIVKDNQKLKIVLEANGTEFKVDTSQNPEGYSFGKIYRPNIAKNTQDYNGFGFYLVPTIYVTDISNDGKTITTNIPVSSQLNVDDNIEYSKYLQFCRLGKTLEIDLVQDLGTFIPITGFGQEIVIDKLSDGRITNIVVANGGQNFLQNTLPIVTVGNYDYYLT